MQACGGATVMGSLQQPICCKITSLPLKGFDASGFPNQIQFISVKPYRVSGFQGNMVTGRPPSSVSMAMPNNIGNYS